MPPACWGIMAEQSGLYVFEQRRWPQEAGHSIAGGIEGKDHENNWQIASRVARQKALYTCQGLSFRAKSRNLKACIFGRYPVLTQGGRKPAIPDRTGTGLLAEPFFGRTISGPERTICPANIQDIHANIHACQIDGRPDPRYHAGNKFSRMLC